MTFTDENNNYGYYHPPYLFAKFITLSQNCPHNWFGKQLALVLRKLVLLFCKQPVDASVGQIRMRCYLNDNVSERKFLFLPWLYDPQERELVTDQLPADGVFVDIGANAGIYTLWACQLLSERGTVIAIEPNPVAYGRLEFNLQANREHRTGWPRVQTLPIAAGEHDGVMELHLDRSNLGAASLVTHQPASNSIQVKCRPLLPVLSECGVDKIDILKIDIEGAEDIVLAPFLETAPVMLLPRFIIIENSEHLWRSDLVSLIKRHDYISVFRTRMNTVYRYSPT